MFGKNKNAILHTNLIVKVRKYKNEQPYFSFLNNPAIADETKARLTVEKLNEIAELDKEENWQTQYYSVSLTLQKEIMQQLKFNFRKPRKKKDNSKNGDVFTNCRDDRCKAPLYKNTSQSDTRYCMDCL